MGDGGNYDTDYHAFRERLTRFADARARSAEQAVAAQREDARVVDAYYKDYIKDFPMVMRADCSTRLKRYR